MKRNEFLNQIRQDMDFQKMTNAMQKSVRIMKWTGVIVGIIGLCLLLWQNWVIAIGVWLMLWGNNLEERGKRAEQEMKQADLQKRAMEMIGGLGGMFGGKQKMD